MASTTNIEAEQLAIISILNSKQQDQWVVGKLLGNLTGDDFGTDPGSEVIAKILARIRTGADLPKRNTFKLDSTLSEEARDFLSNIQAKPIHDEASVDALIETLRFHRKIRKIVYAAKEMVEACKKATVDDIGLVENKLDQLTLDVKGSEDAAKIVTFGAGDETQARDVISRILSSNNAKKINTGFNSFDERSGFRKGQAVLIAGPSSGGKSALAQQLVLNMYLNDHHNTLFVSMEMDDEECIGRLCANVARLNFEKVEQKTLNALEATKLTNEIDRFIDIGKKNDCWFKVWNPTDDITAAGLMAYARPLKADVIVVDYIGLLAQDNTKEEQWRALGSMMRMFKIAAKKLGCCIIVLAQFDEDNMVVKYARALREHANIMWCWQYGEAERVSGIVTILQVPPFGKNRNAKPFNFRLKFELSEMRIVDYGIAAVGDTDSTGTPKPKPQEGVKGRRQGPRPSKPMFVLDDDE